jgi:hypothetical protein
VNTEALIACNFCRELNPASLQMCRNCGLEKRERTEPATSIDSFASGSSTTSEELAGVQPLKTSVEALNVDAAPKPESLMLLNG